MAEVDREKDKSGTWETKNGRGLLSEKSIRFNAKAFVKYFKSLRSYSNWSDNAICGLFGNVVRESHVDPRCVGSNNAYGLIQWDPKSALKTLARKIGLSGSYDDMYTQCKCIDYDSKYNAVGKWYSKTSSVYPIPSAYQGVTYKQFAESDKSVAWCTECFLYCYEKAGVPALNERLQWANWLKNSGLLEGESASVEDTAIDDFVNWLIMIADNNEYIYHLGANHKNPPNWSSYLTDKRFDCSSFISYGLYVGGGYDIPKVFTTDTQRAELVEFGFDAIAFKNKSQLKKGDILLKDGHTEAVVGTNGQTVMLCGAHQHYPDRPWDDISVIPFYEQGNPWHTIIRPYSKGGQEYTSQRYKRNGLIYTYGRK